MFNNFIKSLNQSDYIWIIKLLLSWKIKEEIF
jgi:hypothetical protein